MFLGERDMRMNVQLSIWPDAFHPRGAICSQAQAGAEVPRFKNWQRSLVFPNPVPCEFIDERHALKLNIRTIQPPCKPSCPLILREDVDSPVYGKPSIHHANHVQNLTIGDFFGSY